MDEREFEIAAWLEQMERDQAIHTTRKRAVTPPLPDDFDGSCPECGADIPEARVAAGYGVCVDCVCESEHRRRTQGY
jgi:RNA polymerase-binding transcription factor DksA